MPDPIIYVDRSLIVDGKLEQLKSGIRALVEFVEHRESRLISYGFFLDEERMRMTVIAIHPDSASLEFHLDIAGPEFRKLKELVELTEIEVYGPLEDTALVQLQEKARMLGRAGKVVVLQAEAGFARLTG
ncbi:MAG TPA: hypothetical protein VNP97_13645 [Microbacterium sp.]|nr:hypothetical protein [Microbacterium sp.]